MSGYTYLVNELQVVMSDVQNERFTRTQVNQELLKEYVGGKVKYFDCLCIIQVFINRLNIY